MSSIQVTVAILNREGSKCLLTIFLSMLLKECNAVDYLMSWFFSQDFWWWKDSWYHWSQSCEDGRARGWRNRPRHNRLPGSKGKNLSSLYKVNQNDQLYQMPKLLFLNQLKCITKNSWNKILCTPHLPKLRITLLFKKKYTLSSLS